MGLINPPVKKKKYVNREVLEGVVSKYEELVESILKKPKKSKYKELKSFLLDQKDNEHILNELSENTEHSFIARLLITYKGTQDLTDTVIFDLLKIYERTLKFNFKPLLPLVCGPNTEDHYMNLVKLGRALHVCPTTDQVLKGLTPDLLWETGLYASCFDPAKPETNNPLHYDPRYISMLLLGMVNAGSDLTLRLFVEQNALSFAAFLLSHPISEIRMFGYAILSDFLLKLQDISAEDFVEKPLFIYTLIYLKGSLKKKNMQIENASAHFFAKVFKLFLQSESPVYSKIVAFLAIKPDFNFNTVPEFLRMMLSTSTETYKDERIWVLDLALGSMLSNRDFSTFEKVNGTSLCLSMFASPFADKSTMRHIFFLLQRIVNLSTGSRVLYQNYNFHTWVTTTLQFKTLTRWEIGFLTQIFVKYVEVLRLEATNNEKFDYASKEKLIISCVKKVAAVVGSVDDEVKDKWLLQLDSLSKPLDLASSEE